jgi:hypothetical protein
MILAWLACRPAPSLPPEGSSIAASLHLQHRESGAYGALLDFLGGEVRPEPAWDECHEIGSGGAVGVAGVAPPIEVGETWLWVDGERDWFANPDTSLQNLEIAGPYGRWVGVGWSGGDTLDAFDVEEGLFVPEPLVFTEPALDSDAILDPSRELDLRWNTSSDGSLSLTLKGGEIAISCVARDDGRFSIPKALLEGLQGEAELWARRHAWAYHELPSGELLELEAWDIQEGTLRFED